MPFRISGHKIMSLFLVLTLVSGRGYAHARDPVYPLAQKAALLKDHQSVLKAWLVAHSLSQSGRWIDRSSFDRVLWLALNEEKLCPDLAPRRDDLGLWSIVLYNFALRPTRESLSYRSFEGGSNSSSQLVRLIDLEDFLNYEEWKSLKIIRGPCGLTQRLDRLATRISEDLSEDGVASSRQNHFQKLLLLEALLQQALRELKPEVGGRAIIEARLEQIRMSMARLKKSPEPLQHGKKLASLTAEDWASLDQGVASELFEVWQTQVSPEASQELALSVIDVLIEKAWVAKIDFWIAQASAGKKLRAIWEGQRGFNLLQLHSFRERALLALYRGIDQIDAQNIAAAFQSFALARSFATQSSVARDIHQALDSWISYVVLRHRASTELLQYMTAYLDQQDLNSMIKQMVWQAALHGDPFLDQLLKHALIPSSMKRQAPWFKALAKGQLVTWNLSGTEAGAAESLRFIRDYATQLELSSFVMLQRHRMQILKLERSLKADSSPQWKSLKRESLEILGRVSLALQKNTDGEYQGRKDKQEVPQALGASLLTPPPPDLWPFRIQDPEEGILQPLAIHFSLDDAGKELWKIIHPQEDAGS